MELMLALVLLSSSDEAAQSISHVRSLNPVVMSALQEGLSRSPTFRALVEEIEASNAIVYLEEGHCPASAACTMIAPTADERVRLLRIHFVLRTPQGATALLCHRDRLIAQIGHELQHAVEITRDPLVVDEATLTALYVRIGRPSRSKAYESDAAVRAGELVFSELQHQSAFAVVP